MTIELSTAVKDEAHEMAQQGHLWGRGQSKVNGREFYIIPSRSEEGIAHWTTDYGCTCKGARKHGDCAHQEAVRIFEARQSEPSPRPHNFHWYHDDYAACVDCNRTRNTVSKDEPCPGKPEEAAPVPTFRSYQDLYPGCAAGCGDLVDRQGEMCWACLQKHTRRLEMASKRAAVAGGVR